MRISNTAMPITGYALNIVLLFFAAGLINACAEKIHMSTISFPSEWTRSGTVRFTNGEYRESAAPGSATQTIVKMTEYTAKGQLNGRDAAAVVLVTDPGGSGTFYDLAVIIKTEAGWRSVDTAFLGDRVKIHSLLITDNEIKVEMTLHSPKDKMCCPSLQLTQWFNLIKNQLVRSGTSGSKTVEP